MLYPVEPEPIAWEDLPFDEAAYCQWDRTDPGETLLPEEATELYGRRFLKPGRKTQLGPLWNRQD